jgi:hypothetical protein
MIDQPWREQCKPDSLVKDSFRHTLPSPHNDHQPSRHNPGRYDTGLLGKIPPQGLIPGSTYESQTKNADHNNQDNQ